MRARQEHNKRVKVSVIIPVYNAENSIKQCLDSILRQTLREIEIICVDDGSTDHTYEILKDYECKDLRIRVISQQNAGAGSARNVGLRSARGEYLSFLDADDFFEREMLEKAYTSACVVQADVVVFHCDLFSEKFNTYRRCWYSINQKILPKKQPFAGTDIQQDIFKLFVGWAWDKLFRTEFIRENGLLFQEQRTTNDLLFVYSAVVLSKKIITLKEVLVHHRYETVSLSTTRENSWHCFYDALLELKAQLVKVGLFERFERDYVNYCVHFSLWQLNTLAEPTHTILHNRLRECWFDELGVTRYPAEYFYNRHEYLQYRRVYEYPAGTVLSEEEKKRWDNLENKSILQRAYVCLQENGIRYTVKRATDRLLRR